MFQIFEKEEKRFFLKSKKIFYFNVILESCTILIDFNSLWLNIMLCMSIFYMLDLSPKYVILYPSSNPDISL